MTKSKFYFTLLTLLENLKAIKNECGSVLFRTTRKVFFGFSGAMNNVRKDESGKQGGVMPRWIGIRHRVKTKADGAVCPTEACIIYMTGQIVTYKLETETDELDWVLGRYPSKWRLAMRGMDEQYVKELESNQHQRHLRWRKARDNEDVSGRFTEELKGKLCVLEIPEAYEGLKAGDAVGLVLSGSANRLAFALSNRAEKLGNGTKVLRLQSGKLDNWRKAFNRKKEEDSRTLAELIKGCQDEFLAMTARDRDQIRLAEAWRNRTDAMKARIAAEQRLRSSLIGRIFCSQTGQYPQGEIQAEYERQRTNDSIIKALETEEKARNREVENILKTLPVYEKLFAGIEGVGPMIAARLIVAIGDVRRFETDSKLKAFLGVHVQNGGNFGDRPTERQFPRRRTGETAGWHPEGRQALYLLVDQFNRRPDSVWGKKLREIKSNFRAKHPHAVCVACNLPLEQCSKDKGREHKSRYSDGHIHKMALWRTATKFVEWLYGEWTALEKGEQKTPILTAA